MYICKQLYIIVYMFILDSLVLAVKLSHTKHTQINTNYYSNLFWGDTDEVEPYSYQHLQKFEN